MPVFKNESTAVPYENTSTDQNVICLYTFIKTLQITQVRHKIEKSQTLKIFEPIFPLVSNKLLRHNLFQINFCYLDILDQA